MEERRIIQNYEEKRKLVSKFHLTSDLFSSKVLEDIQGCQEVCRILLEDDVLEIKSVKTQYSIRNLENRSIWLDVLAEASENRLILLEIQMYPEKNPLKRVRYYTSSIDVSVLEKGVDYEDLPNVTTIYITRQDFIGEGKGCYKVLRKIDGKKNEIALDNGQKEIYYNLEHPTGNVAIDELLDYFQDSDPYYQTERFPKLVERVRFYKVQKEGVEVMCEVVDEIVAEVVDEIVGEMADEIRREGKIEGKIEGKKGSVVELLEELGKVPQRLLQRIQKETDLSVLSKWLKYAAKANNIQEFEMKINEI